MEIGDTFLLEIGDTFLPEIGDTFLRDRVLYLYMGLSTYVNQYPAVTSTEPLMLVLPLTVVINGIAYINLTPTCRHLAVKETR